MEYEKVWQEAKEKAQLAAEKENEQLGPEHCRGLDCGFAWIVIQPARGGMVQYLKKNGIGRTRSYGGGGGFEIWSSQFHDVSTQSISVKEAAARAACEVLKKAGVNASVGTRLD